MLITPELLLEYGFECASKSMQMWIKSKRVWSFHTGDWKEKTSVVNRHNKNDKSVSNGRKTSYPVTDGFFYLFDSNIAPATNGVYCNFKKAKTEEELKVLYLEEFNEELTKSAYRNEN